MAHLPTPAPNNSPGTTLPAGSRAPTWNGVMVETHYVYSPQLIFIQRSEWQRMSHSRRLPTSRLEPREFRHVHLRISLHADYDEPGGLCMAQRIFVVPLRGNSPRRLGT